MIRMISNLVTRKAVLAVAGVIGLGAIAAVPQPAQAGFHIGFDVREQPAYQDRTTQVWVEPVYQTVSQRVWVEPAYQTVSDRVWVPPHYENQPIGRYDGWRRQPVVQQVYVPGHYELQSRQVLIADAHWADVPQQQVIVPGHWETRVDRIACADPGPQVDRLHVDFGHR